jgi:hypothetical protein
MDGLYLNPILGFVVRGREDQVPVLQVNRVVSGSLLQEHGYRNTGGMGKELAYGAYPAQLTMLKLRETLS